MRHFLPVLLLPIAFSLSVPTIKIDALKKRMSEGKDTVYVVNYWATWCGPCVKELPEFEKLDSVYKTEKVKVLLVSQDFKKDIDTRLIPFLEKNKIHSEVLLLDELYDNEWIPKVDSMWQGNIPATKIFCPKTGDEIFFADETDFHELDSIVSLFLYRADH